jgi:hypothetical protein
MTQSLSESRVTEIVGFIRHAQERACNEFLAIGAYLIEVKDKQLFKAWGPGLSFDDFVEDIGLSRTTAYNCIAVVKRFGELDVKGIPMDRLVQLLPLKMEGDEVEQWVEKARELPARGLRDEIRQVRDVPGEQPIDLCGHAKHKCADCGIILDN